MGIGLRRLSVMLTMAIVVAAGCAGQSATQPPTPSPTLAPTPTPAAAVPTYSAVVKTYQADVRMCGEVGDWFKGALGFDVTCADVIHFAGAGTKADTVVASVGGTKLEISPDVFRDYGVKIVMDVATTLGGTTYAAGAMLTVDSSRSWTQVSGWE